LTQSFDVVVLLIFVPVQWRITVLWLRAARRLPALRGVVLLFNGLMAAGWLLAFIPAIGGFFLPGRLSLLLRTFTLAYGMTATAFLALRAILQPFGKLVAGGDFNPGRRRAIRAAVNLAAATPFAALSYGALVGRLDFRIREVDVPLPGLPADLDGLRVLHLSDIHLGAFLSEAQLARVVDAANGLHPHLAAVTGDLISERNDPILPCIRQLARLKADAGVVACMGNHERYAGLDGAAAAAGARAGIPFLRGATRPLRFGNATLHVAGVDYQPLFQKANYLRGAGGLVAPGETNLLLSHNPDVFPVAARLGYNLLLAGHTHGGQISVEILDQAINPARFFTPYVYGLYRQGRASAYVTRGIGTIGIPARLGAPPEIALLRLRKA
jgi:predicted MPP superfamily phosphohydrolase